MQRWLILFALAGVPLAGAGPGPGNPAPAGPPRLVGGFKPLEVDQPLVKDAKAAIQSYFASLKLEAVLAAEVQVVAGTNFRMICQVQEPDGPATWRFVIWHRLDGKWRLTSARRQREPPVAGSATAAPAPAKD